MKHINKLYKQIICLMLSAGMLLGLISIDTKDVYAASAFITDDGMEWEVNTLNNEMSSKYFLDVCWSPELELFVSVGGTNISNQTGPLCTSKDGVNWVTQFTDADGFTKFTSVCWSSELQLFVIVGYNNSMSGYTSSYRRIYTSPNGVNWTRRMYDDVPGGSLDDVCWSPELGIFVAIGKEVNGKRRVYKSSDSITWSITYTDPYAGVKLNTITWSSDLNIFVAVGNAIVTSPDAETWTERLSLSFNDVCWSSELNMFIAVGSGSKNIYKSDDGITWTRVANGPDKVDFQSVCWSDELNRFMAVGYYELDSGTYQTRICSSEDGINWLSQVHDIDKSSAGLNAICWASALKIYVAVGRSGIRSYYGLTMTGIQTDQITNDDYMSWNVQQKSNDDAIMQAVCYSPERNQFVAVGKSSNNNTKYRRIYSSTDGKHWDWISKTSDEQIHATLNDVCWSPDLSLFITVGEKPVGSYDYKGVIFTSPDAITWTERFTSEVESLNAICWSPKLKKLVAVSSSMNVYISTDGIEWIKQWSTSEQGVFNDICWSEEKNQFIAVGYKGSASETYSNCRMYTSPDGVNWTVGITDTNSAKLTSISWSPLLKMYVAVGYDNHDSTNYKKRIYTSPNGIETWTERVSDDEGGVLTSVCWSQEIQMFVAVGYSESMSSSIPNQRRVYKSSDGINWNKGENIIDLINNCTVNYVYESINDICWVSSLGSFIAVGHIRSNDNIKYLGLFLSNGPYEFELNNSTLHFNYQGATSGNIETTRSVTYGQSIGMLPAPTKTGYAFVGWYTGPDGTGARYTDDMTFQDETDIDLYAYWTSQAYQLRFDYQDATGGATETTRSVSYGQSIGTLPAPTKTGNTFAGWYTGPDGTGEQYTKDTTYQHEDNITLYANWTANQSQLTFHYQGATSGYNESTRAVESGQSIGILPTPIKDGYNFDGWHTEDSVPYQNNAIYQSESDTDLYAQWIPREYTITFDYQEATGGITESNRLVYYDDVLTTLPFPQQTGYGFDGWYTYPNGQGDLYQAGMKYLITEPVTLYANWLPDLYDIVFHYQAATSAHSPAGQDAYYGQPVGVLPEPSKDGYVFTGWYTQPEGQGIEYTEATLFQETEALHLYANWTPALYRLSYDANGSQGSVPVDPATYHFNELAVVQGASLTKEGYIFGGWNIDTDVNRIVYQSGECIVMNDNITLFAYWVQEETGTPQPVEKPVEKTVYVPVYIDRQSGSDNTSQNDDAAQNKSFTVKYNANGGTGSVPVDKHQYRMDAKVLAMSQGSLKRDNYSFAGWCISPNGNDSTYWPGHHFWISRNITLYALWIPVR